MNKYLGHILKCIGLKHGSIFSISYSNIRHSPQHVYSCFLTANLACTAHRSIFLSCVFFFQRKRAACFNRPGLLLSSHLCTCLCFTYSTAVNATNTLFLLCFPHRITKIGQREQRWPTTEWSGDMRGKKEEIWKCVVWSCQLWWLILFFHVRKT